MGEGDPRCDSLKVKPVLRYLNLGYGSISKSIQSLLSALDEMKTRPTFIFLENVRGFEVSNFGVT